MTWIETERERAKAIAGFHARGRNALRKLGPWPLRDSLDLRLGISTIAKLRYEFLKGGDEMPKTEETSAVMTLERIARIASKTEPVRGQDEKLSEYDALVMILRELRDFDPTILDRNMRRVLPKQVVEVTER